MAQLADLINLDLSDCTEKIIAEYIWVGGSGMDVRSKARVSTPFPSSMITMNPYLDQFSLDDMCRASVPFEL